MGRRRPEQADEFPLWIWMGRGGGFGGIWGVGSAETPSPAWIQLITGEWGGWGSIQGLLAIFHKVPRQYGSQGAAGCQGRKLQRG